MLAGAIVMVAQAFLVEVQRIGPYAERLVQDRQRRHGIVAHLGAVAGIKGLGRVIADHLDADRHPVVAGGVDAIGGEIAGDPDQIGRDENMRARMPAFVAVVIMVEVFHPLRARNLAEAGVVPLRQVRLGGIVQHDELRAPTGPFERFDIGSEFRGREAQRIGQEGHGDFPF